MKPLIDTRASWGTYTPRGRDRLLFLIRDAGLAHGRIKQYLSNAWLAGHPESPVDILYRQMKYRLYPQDNVTDRKLLFGSRQRDRAELNALQRAVTGGGTFVDIGANIGHYTLMAASFGASRVIAIEPNPDALARLEFNIAANDLHGCVSIIPTALGETEGKATLYVPVEGDMGGGKVSNSILDGRQVDVMVKPLTLVLEEQGIERIDALKIDVEGMEDRVLLPFFKSASPSLWPKLVIIEHTSAPEWEHDILAWLLSHGYRTDARTHSNMMLHLDSSNIES